MDGMEPLVRIEHSATGSSADVWAGPLRLVRLTRLTAKTIYGRVTPLFAHRDGRSVLKDEAKGLKKLGLLCGLVLCTERGTVMLQWRGFGA
jgi:hypothetical protein